MSSKGPTITSRVAWGGVGEHFFQGHRVLGELLGNASLTDMFFLACNDALPDAESRRVLDDLAITITAADARIWPLKVGRIVASYGSAGIGLAASVLAYDRLSSLGPYTVALAASFLMRFERALAAGDRSAQDAILSEKLLPGWGIALRAQDERYLALAARMQGQGRCTRRFWAAHEVAVERVREARGLEPNMSGGFAPALLDLGIERPDRIALLVDLLCVHLAAAHVLECADQRPRAYRDLDLDHVEHRGVARRPVPPGGVRPG